MNFLENPFALSLALDPGEDPGPGLEEVLNPSDDDDEEDDD